MTDLAGRNFIKRGNSLVPADFAAEEFLGEIGNGREVIVAIRKARNPRHHRWFFALLRKVRENTEQWQSEEALLDDLKLVVGHTEKHINPISGEIVVRAKSISFAAMDQLSFGRFAKRCAYVLATKVLGCDPDDLMREVEETQQVQSPPVAPDAPRSRVPA